MIHIYSRPLTRIMEAHMQTIVEVYDHKSLTLLLKGTPDICTRTISYYSHLMSSNQAFTIHTVHTTQLLPPPPKEEFRFKPHLWAQRPR